MSGWACRYITLSDGRRQILSFALPGDMLGFHVNFRRMANYSAAAITNAKLAVVQPLRTLEIAQQYPLLSSGLSWCSAREFAILGEQALRLGRLSAFERTAHLFLELWQRLRLIGEVSDDRFDMPITQLELSDALGMTPVHMSRTMKKLFEEGLISSDDGNIKLMDVKQLIKLSHFNPDILSEFRL